MKQECYQGNYINKTDHHIYIAPDDEVKNVVAHYTVTYPSEEPIACDKYHILPDASGCIIFQKEHLDFWGVMQELVIQENDLLWADPRLFIEFRPGGLYRISGKPLHPYVNCRKPLTFFDPSVAKTLHHFYAISDTYDDLIHYCNEWILKQASRYPIPKRVLEASALIDQHHGTIGIEEVAVLCSVSLRQLRRDFAVYIGLSPKQYANVIRMNYVVKELSNDHFIKKALQGGFFDQAHFNKVFKQMLHVSPSQYIKNVDDFYRELYKF